MASIGKKPTQLDRGLASKQHAASNAPPGLKLKNMDEKNMHNLFLKNMSGLIEIAKNPHSGECSNP